MKTTTLIGLCLVVVLMCGNASAWLSGYDHRMAITVNNGGASTLNYYQFNFTNDTNTLVAVGHMQVTGADCRVTDASDTLIPFWNETPFNAVGTEIYANATTLAVGDNTFYMYYGNAGASSAVNGDATFPFFDDFHGTSLDVTPTSEDATVSAIVNKYEAWGGIAKDSSGNLYAAYRTSDGNTHMFDSTGRLVIRKSTDDGETWGAETIIANEAGGDDRVTTNLLVFDYSGTERIVCCYHVDDASNKAISYSVYSDDHGVSWSSRKLIYGNATHQGHTAGQTILTSQDKLLVGVLVDKDVTWQTAVFESSDGGDTWTRYNMSGINSNHNEITIIETKTGGSYTGGMYALFTTPAGGNVDLKTSTDYGHTWSGFSDSGLPLDEDSKMNLYRLESGNIIVSGTQNSGDLDIYESDDECATWTYKTTVITGASIEYYPSVINIDSSHLIVLWCVNGATSDQYVNFIDYPLSPAKWNVAQGTVGVSNSILSLTTNPTSVCSASKVFTQPMIVRSKLKFSNTGEHNMFYGTDQNTGGVNQNSVGFLKYSQMRKQMYKNGAWTEQNDAKVGMGTYRTYEIKWKTDEAKFYDEGNLEATFVTDVPTADLYLLLSRDNAPTTPFYSDWILVRKYASPNPTSSLGAEEDAPPGTIPPTPTTLANTTGNFWVNHTWSAGSGNVTDSYNVSQNGTWTNASSNLYFNATDVGAHGYSDVTVWAWNSSGSGTLSAGSITQNTTVPNNVIAISDVFSSYSILEGETLSIDANYTDADGDTGTFADNSTEWNVNSGTGIVSWVTVDGDQGTYGWLINVSDGYGSTSTQEFVVTVTDSTPTAVSNMANTTGNFWINWTWDAGANVDDYDVWIDEADIGADITNLYYNHSASAHATVNISVRSHNHTLSAYSGWVNDTMAVPNNAITITNTSDWSGDEGQNVYVDYDATDADSDTPTFSCNRTDLFTDFSTSTGKGNWTSVAGTYHVDFGVSDGYGSTSNYTMTITVVTPKLNFIDPTPANESTIYVNHTTINVSIATSDLTYFAFNWNGTNKTYTTCGTQWNESLDSYVRTTTVGSYTQQDFDNIFPWSHIRRCTLWDNGTVNYYLNATNSSLKATGGLADISGADGQVMVQIPKFHYDHTFTGSTHDYNISRFNLTGFAVHEAFNKSGVEVDYRYIAAYEGSMWDATTSAMVSSANIVTDMYASGDKLCSISDEYPKTNEMRSEFRTMAAQRGAGWRQLDFDLNSAVQLLYIIEYADFDSQTEIGYGRTQLSGGTWTAGSYIGQCGKSNSDGDGTNSVAGNTNDAYMTYRGIENWYGNIWKWNDGININNNIPYVSNNDSIWADDTSTGYTDLSITLANANGYQATLEQTNRGFLPASVGGTSSTYVSDYYYQDTGWRVVVLGGNAGSGASAGAFYLAAADAASRNGANVGGRLAY